jgi:hypothetical protein
VNVSAACCCLLILPIHPPLLVCTAIVVSQISNTFKQTQTNKIMFILVYLWTMTLTLLNPRTQGEVLNPRIQGLFFILDLFTRSVKEVDGLLCLVAFLLTPSQIILTTLNDA